MRSSRIGLALLSFLLSAWSPPCQLECSRSWEEYQIPFRMRYAIGIKKGELVAVVVNQCVRPFSEYAKCGWSWNMIGQEPWS